MQNITTLDLSNLPQNDAGGWLVGAPGEREDSAVRVVHAASNASFGLQSCAVDRLCFILSGTMAITIGTESFDVGKHSLVFLPAGTPHRETSSGKGDLIYLEIFAPAPPLPIFTAAKPRPIADAASCIRTAKPGAFSGGGFASTTLAQRDTGSNHVRINRVQVSAGAGSPDFHIHAFDQFYFILEGTMTVEIGKKRFQVPPNSLVRLPAGLVHRNYNAGHVAEGHVALLVPEPAVGEIFDYAIDIHDYEAERLTEIPAA